MKINSLLLAIGLLALSLNGKAQGTVQVVSDPLLDSIIEAEAEFHKTQGTLSGYRIQIFFGSERKAANEARTHFLQLYPETEAYMLYQQPYFKVRVGDYRTRYEAYATYKKLVPLFDKIFIVPDKINLPKL